MSSTETVKKPVPQNVAPLRKSAYFLVKALDFISSVKFGVVLLCMMVILSILGMIIIQQNVSGFDAYYAGLTPAQKIVYGWLGLFDVYNSWYFSGLLLILSLNIVLASIDRFPSAWSYIVKPKLTATDDWIRGRMVSATIAISASSVEEATQKVALVMKRRGLKPTISEKNDEIFVFGERGKWNRLGAYIVHVCLLTLFLGHFVAIQTGFDADVGFQPGQTTTEIELIEFDLDKQNRFAASLPFTITCLDIQQKLIDPNGSIDTSNTLDWVTKIRIDDPDFGVTEADVGLNKPFSYRGYRFFQAQTVPIGNARSLKLTLTPDTEGSKPQNVSIKRNGSATLDDGMVIKYEEFLPDFTFNREGQPDTRSGDYNNPAAVLSVTPKNEQPVRVFAFAGDLTDDMPVGAAKAGYKWKLTEFEKSPRAHILSIKYDPYNGAFIAWYFGGVGLIGALIFVFFISHGRVWALVRESKGKFEAVVGGDTNRNHQGFEDKFAALTAGLGDVEDDPEKEGE